MANAARKPTPAQARKAEATKAYVEKFGNAPKGRMSASALERAVAPRRAPSERWRAEAPKPVAAQPKTPDGRPMPKAFGTGSARQAEAARSKLPYDTWRKVSDLKYGKFDGWQMDRKTVDRNAAAQALREHRATLGRNLPTGTIGTAVKKFAMKNGENLRVAGEIGKGVVGVGMVMKASGKIGEGFMLDGMRGAIHEAADFATLGMGGGKLVDKVLGKPDVGNMINRIMTFETPGQSSARKTQEMVQKRPTRKMREGIDKAHGIDPPKKPPMTPRTKQDVVNTLGSMAVGGVMAMPVVGAQMAILEKTSSLALAGLKAVAPKAAAAVPGVGLAVLGAGVAYSAVKGYQKDGVKGAAMGAADSLTMGGASKVASLLSPGQQQQFKQADAAFKSKREAAAAPADAGSDKKRGWANPKVQKAAKEAQGKKFNGDA